MRKMAATADDYVALHFVPSDGGPWAGFLKTKLNEKRYGIKVQFYKATQDLDPEHKYGANVLLVSPDFLTIESFEKYSRFQAATSLVVLLGTTEEEYRVACAKNNGQFMNKWPIFETHQNESSVRALLIEIIDLYEHAHVHHGHDSPDDSDNDSERGLDSVSQMSEFSEEGPEYDRLPPPRPIVHPKPPKPLPADDKNTMLKAVTANNDKEVIVLMDKEGDGAVTVVVDDEVDHPLSCSLLKAAVYTCNIPKPRRPDVQGPSKLTIRHEDKDVGKLKLGTSRTSVTAKTETVDGKETDKLTLLNSILDAETDPICMMCKALRLPEPTREALDHALSDKCNKFRQLGVLGNFLMLDDQPTTFEDKDSIWPTLLHFGAEYNLIKFCDELLHFPAMLQSCQIVNKLGETPEQMARRLGHVNLADLFESSLVQQREKRNSPGNKDSGYVGDLRMTTSTRSMMEEEEEEEDEDQGDEEYMKMDQKITSPNLRSDSVLEGNEDDDDDDDDDEEELYKIPPPQPHVMKPAYLNQESTKKAGDEDDNDNEDNDEHYEVPPEPKPVPCPNTTVHRKKRGPVPTPPPDYYHDEAPGDYMDMSGMKKDLPSPRPRLDVRLSGGSEDSPSPHQSIVSQSSSTSSEGLMSPQQGIREDFSHSPQCCAATMPRGDRGEQMTRSHSESDSAHLYHPHHPHSPPDPYPHTRHLSISEQGDQGCPQRHSRGLLSKLGHKFHFPHGKHRKQSLPDITIPEEVLKKAKKKDKQKSPLEHRVSDVSTTSTNSNSSNDGSGVEKREKSKEGKAKKKSRTLFGRKKTMDVSEPFEQLECVEENRRKSVRIAHIMKDDNLTVLDLPGKNY